MRKDFKKIIEESSVLKELKTQEDVSRLLKDLHSNLLESMLSGELESHLGYTKNEKSEASNAPNRTTTKRLKNLLLRFPEIVKEVLSLLLYPNINPQLSQ
ncbi:hypothetical protein AB9J70_07360 [Elizabethkingia anophelis]|uniref:hypothetical protein n=1 Tax=Elizabethkingia anophelis TaxID=1117645 RepID=UPI0035562073